MRVSPVALHKALHSFFHFFLHEWLLHTRLLYVPTLARSILSNALFDIWRCGCRIICYLENLLTNRLFVVENHLMTDVQHSGWSTAEIKMRTLICGCLYVVWTREQPACAQLNWEGDDRCQTRSFNDYELMIPTPSLTCSIKTRSCERNVC